jgi:hypothetical protein
MILKDSIPTSQKVQRVSTEKPNRLILFTEIFTVHCDNHGTHNFIVHKMQNLLPVNQVVCTITTAF